MGGYYGPPESGEQPAYPAQYPPSPAYGPPPGYPQPPGYPHPQGYPQGQAYPQAQGYPPPYGYPPPPGSGYPPPYPYYWPKPVRVTPVAVGLALSGAAVLMVIGGLLSWITGPVHAPFVQAAMDRNQLSDDDRIAGIVFAALLLVAGILICLKQGRLWVGITGIVIAAFGLLPGLSDLTEISDTNSDLPGLSHIGVGAGLVLYAVASFGALAATIVATSVRRPRR